MLIVTIMALDMPFEDEAIVAETHFPVASDVVLYDVILLWVRRHLQMLLRPL